MRLPEIFTLPRSIRFIIVVAFTAVSVSITGLLGVGLYRIFARHTEQLLTESSAQLLHRVSENLGDYLKNMRALSDAIYYASIKSKDFAVDNTNREMELLYEANRDDLISLALYRRDGTLLRNRMSMCGGRPGFRARRQRSKICTFRRRMCRISLTTRATAITGSSR